MPKQKVRPLLLDLGKLVRKARNKYGISQGNLSLKAGLQYTYISALERGVYNPTFVVLKKIAVALDISLAELLTDIDMSIFDPKDEHPVHPSQGEYK